MNLIERICKCGCGISFKCLQSSGQRYYSKLHMDSDFAKNSTSGNAKKRRSDTIVYTEVKKFMQTSRDKETEGFLN